MDSVGWSEDCNAKLSRGSNGEDSGKGNRGVV